MAKQAGTVSNFKHTATSSLKDWGMLGCENCRGSGFEAGVGQRPISRKSSCNASHRIPGVSAKANIAERDESAAAIIGSWHHLPTVIHVYLLELAKTMRLVSVSKYEVLRKRDPVTFRRVAWIIW